MTDAIEIITKGLIYDEDEEGKLFLRFINPGERVYVFDRNIISKEEAMRKTGFPDETTFDQHVDSLVTRRNIL